jgi:AhpD family alkylhydroperoxidase
MLVKRVVSSATQRQVRYVKPVSALSADGLVGEVYAQVADEMRIVTPPMLMHSPAPESLAAYWMLMREPLIAAGHVGRLAKEAVAAAVSVANICPYCVDMHSMGMYDLSTEADAEAIVADRVHDMADEATRDVAAWARRAHLPGAPGTLAPPFPPSHAPELIGVVVSFHYLNRMVNVFLSSFLVPPRLRGSARRRMKQGISRVLAPMLRNPGLQGRSLALLPEAPLPPDASWAAGSPHVAQAVARATAAFEAAGERSLSPAVREMVLRRLSHWVGEETPLSRAWCEELIGDLPEKDRAAGRLALLTAIASYQVDEDVVTEFRRAESSDTVLVEAAAWASFAAARRVGSWHSAAATEPGRAVRTAGVDRGPDLG